MKAPPLRLGELAATLALAQDNAFGQPAESQFRSCLLAMWLSDRAGFDVHTRQTIFWTALLRYIGCTGHAHEVATLFGDEIAIRAQTLVHDAANREEVMQDVVAFATVGREAAERAQIIAMIEQGAEAWAINNFASGCEVADTLLRQLTFDNDVRAALRCTFERWNGAGFPTGVRGDAIPLAMRVVHLTHDMEAIARIFSVDKAMRAVSDRRDRTYDPVLADMFAEHGRAWLDALRTVDPWDAVLALEPTPHRMLDGAVLDEALQVLADFIDLKSPHRSGHSRRCAELCRDAARQLGLAEDEVTRLWRAGLVHDLGTTGVSNAILDKPSSLTRAEFDRVELHPMVTEQMLRRSPALSALNAIAAAHHEKTDGSGYHKRLRGAAVDPNAGVLTAADIYVALTTDRADRPKLEGDLAAKELRRLVSEGVLDARAAGAVLHAAGHQETGRRRRPQNPGGLSVREVEVLRLAARGLTTAQIAKQLYISPKTADHHIQHVYTKIGVSTRAAAALWASQNAFLD